MAEVNTLRALPLDIGVNPKEKVRKSLVPVWHNVPT